MAIQIVILITNELKKEKSLYLSCFFLDFFLEIWLGEK